MAIVANPEVGCPIFRDIVSVLPCPIEAAKLVSSPGVHTKALDARRGL
jgi:hypothetical protein